MRVRLERKRESEVERGKNNKISNARATVTGHICTVTVAFVYLCTILHLLMWVFFWSKCVKCLTFSNLQDYATTDVVALRAFALTRTKTFVYFNIKTYFFYFIYLLFKKLNIRLSYLHFISLKYQIFLIILIVYFSFFSHTITFIYSISSSLEYALRF